MKAHMYDTSDINISLESSCFNHLHKRIVPDTAELFSFSNLASDNLCGIYDRIINGTDQDTCPSARLAY